MLRGKLLRLVFPKPKLIDLHAPMLVMAFRDDLEITQAVQQCLKADAKVPLIEQKFIQCDERPLAANSFAQKISWCQERPCKSKRRLLLIHLVVNRQDKVPKLM